MHSLGARRAGVVLFVVVAGLSSVARADDGGLRDASRPGAADCHVPYLAGQDLLADNIALSDLTYVTATHAGRVVAEDFPPPREAALSRPVGIVSFVGVYLDEAGTGCESDDSFEICFYADNGGAPQFPAVVRFAHVEPAIVETVGILDPYDVPRLRFTCVLPEPVNVQLAPFGGYGHFSVAHDGAPTGCYFHLLSSDAPEGNHECHLWYGDDPAGTCAARNFDIHYCFAENAQGACCDDCTPDGCLDDVDTFTCMMLGGRFAAEQTCASMSPSCGAADGACCADDGTCTLTTCAACSTETGAVWLGADTDCADCCTVVCTNSENEPPCGDGYVDTSNAGCESDPPFFTPLACDTTVCGESGTYESATACRGDANCDGEISFGDINPFVEALLAGVYCDGVGMNADVSEDEPCHVGFEDINPFVDLLTGGALPMACAGGPASRAARRDADWYVFTVAEPGMLTWTVEAEFDAHVCVLGPGLDANVPCAGAWVVAEAEGAACAFVSVSTRCLSAGTYWLGVTPTALTDAPCGADYRATLTCTPAVCAQVTCDPNEPGYQLEGEPCGLVDDVNSGCGDVGDPNDDLFTDLVFVESPPGSGIWLAAVCGTLFAGEVEAGASLRDVDWFRYEVGVVEVVQYSVQTEVPLVATPVFSSSLGDPWVCGAELFGYWGLYQEPGYEQPTPVYLVYPGLNYMVVEPQTMLGEPLFTGYPCASGDNTYVLRVVRQAAQ